MSRTVLLTGVNGFIGSAIARSHLNPTWRIRGLVRAQSAKNTPDHAQNLGANCEIVSVPAFKKEHLLKPLQGVTDIIHLAGATKGFCPTDFEHGNLGVTNELLAAAAEICGSKEVSSRSALRMIYVSSLAAGGPSAAGQMRTEEHPDDPVSSYGKSKLAAERALQQTTNQNLKWTIIRPSIVYGPCDKGLLPFFRYAGKGFFFYTSRQVSQRLSFLFIDDLVHAIFRILDCESSIGQTFYLSDGRQYSLGDFCHALEKCSQRSLRSVAVPHSIATHLANIRDCLGKPLGLQPSFFSRDKLLEITQNAWICDPSKAREHFDFHSPTSLETGLQRTQHWYKEQQWIS